MGSATICLKDFKRNHRIYTYLLKNSLYFQALRTIITQGTATEQFNVTISEVWIFFLSECIPIWKKKYPLDNEYEVPFPIFLPLFP